MRPGLLLPLWTHLRAPALGVACAAALSVALLLVFGESPSLLLEAMASTLTTSFGLGYSLFYATPLIFTGLSVALSFHCGLFNIGAEGQLYMGSMAIVAFASAFPNLSPWLAIPSAILAAAVGGGLWGGAAGLLKAKRGSHEVIVTILLNFVAMALVSYLILYVYPNPDSQNPESFTISPNFQIPTLAYLMNVFKSTPVNVSLFIAIGTALALHVLLFKTTYGYEFRAVGANPHASRFAGIAIAKNTFLALALSGALASFVGINEVMGHEHRLIEGFSPAYGFTGIAVALLARNNPLGILFTAFLFGALHNSSRELEFLSEKVTKELSLVLQALLISFVAGEYLLQKLMTRKKAKGEHTHA